MALIPVFTTWVGLKGTGCCSISQEDTETALPYFLIEWEVYFTIPLLVKMKICSFCLLSFAAYDFAGHFIWVKLEPF